MLALAVVVGLVALSAWLFRGEVLYWAEVLVNSAAGSDDPRLMHSLLLPIESSHFSSINQFI